jgi:hypothetical protein
MTELVDGRAAAWIGAWDRIEAAARIRDPGPAVSPADPLAADQWYDRLLKEAELLARLAAVSPDVGYMGGSKIAEDVARAREEQNTTYHDLVMSDLASHEEPMTTEDDEQLPPLMDYPDDYDEH